MTNQIKKAFPQAVKNNCIETVTNPKFWIIDLDDNSKCKLRFELSDDCDFEILNPSEQTINFLAIDKCIFDDSDSKKCDCAIFDDNSFSFIEIKNTAKPRNMRLHRKKGLQQLETTIEIFKRKIDFAGKDLEAYLCFSSSTYPKQTASNQSKIIEFQDKYGVQLKYNNQKKF